MAAAADAGRLLGELADEYDADLIVVGRRGVSRLEVVVLGSESTTPYGKPPSGPRPLHEG